MNRAGGDRYVVTDGRVLTDGVELVVTHHCNLRCRACAYLAPVRPADMVSADDLREDLRVLGRHYHAAEGRVLGGEPLLHPELVRLLHVIRESRICDGIRVITNGALLLRQGISFWQAVDAVSVSMHPGRALPDDAVPRLEATAWRHGVRINFKPFRYFRESYSEPGTSDLALVRRIYRTCQMAHVWRCHTVWNHWLFRCPQSLFLPAVLRDGEQDRRIDGLPLTEAPGFLDDLLAFLQADKPLWSCRHCLGSVGSLFQNQQVPRRAWRDPQRRPTEDLVDWAHLVTLEATPGMFVPDASYLTQAPQ